MRNCRLRIFAASLCIIAGCATVNTYTTPTANGVAEIQGVAHRDGWFDWEHAVVRAVDDKYMPEPFWTRPDKQRVIVTAHKHNLLVHAVFSRTFGDGGPFESCVPVQVEPQANRS